MGHYDDGLSVKSPSLTTGTLYKQATLSGAINEEEPYLKNIVISIVIAGVWRCIQATHVHFYWRVIRT